MNLIQFKVEQDHVLIYNLNIIACHCLLKVYHLFSLKVYHYNHFFKSFFHLLIKDFFPTITFAFYVESGSMMHNTISDGSS